MRLLTWTSCPRRPLIYGSGAPLSPTVPTTTRKISSDPRRPPGSNIPHRIPILRRPSTTWEIDIHAVWNPSVAAETTLFGQSAVLVLHMSASHATTVSTFSARPAGPRGQPRPSRILKTDFLKARKSALSEREMWTRLLHQQIIHDGTSYRHGHDRQDPLSPLLPPVSRGSTVCRLQIRPCWTPVHKM